MIITDIEQRFITSGSYGRTWGDHQYTDVGLDPKEWAGYVLHIHYRPSGSKLLLEIEDGYQFVFNKKDDTRYVLKSTLNWNLIYNVIDEKWYFHSIALSNEINIDTLVVELT